MEGSLSELDAQSILPHVNCAARRLLMKKYHDYISLETPAFAPRIVLKTSWFTTNANELLAQKIPKQGTIEIEVDDIFCTHASIQMAFHLAVSHLSKSIILTDPNQICPIRDDDLQIFSEFDGGLWLPHQASVTDVGIMHLKRTRLLDVGGCINVQGWSLLNLISHFSLCSVFISGRGPHCLSKSCYSQLMKMKDIGIVDIN